MNLDSALKTFINESRELLDEMETALLHLERADDQEQLEHLNAIFRAAHTIKGSAGLFSLDNIVDFTHSAETLLDQLRTGMLDASDELISILFTVRDHLVALIQVVATEGTDSNTDLQAQSRTLQQQINGLLSTNHVSQAKGESTAAKAMARYAEHLQEGDSWIKPQNEAWERITKDTVINDCWHISLRFGKECFRAGLDPLSFISYLKKLGHVRNIVTLDDAFPTVNNFDAEECYLGFEIKFQSDASKQAIEDVFEFARDDAEVRILPPHSRLTEYIELIDKMPEVDLRIGEILLECGALTQNELQKALDCQQELKARNEKKALGEILIESDTALSPVLEAAVQKQQLVRDSLHKDNATLRVDAEKLDTLINLVGELVTAGAGTSLLAQAIGSGELTESVSVLTSLLEDVRDAALRLRMVQIGATFNRFQRIVRDIARELHKEIQLDIKGADTELDKSLVELIGDPLTHLVRNAIDHGIETAEERARAGKPAKGRVSLNAYHDSGNIVIEVSDDGKGLHANTLRTKAIGKGLISDEQVLSRDEILNLIFEPGFSTVDQVSNLSGRGVGMDVVRRNIADLRGRIEVESIEGHGTTFRLFMPLTLAIIDGFLIGVNQAAFVLPLDSILECVELPTNQHRSNQTSDYLNLRGEVLPLLYLRDNFGLTGKPPRRQNVVVVKAAGQTAGLVVDNLMGELQTVIKPLGKIFDGVNGIGGSTILGNGEAALILDVPKLIQQVSHCEPGAAALH